jgi:phosphoglycolate phosphatase-like HAD superfamily hydrolase
MCHRISTCNAVLLWVWTLSSRSSTLNAFTLITFDVDGTLVRGSGQGADTSAHSRAFAHAVGSIWTETGGAPVQPVAQALPQHLYHGSTDGLILMRLAKATLDIPPEVSFPRLPEMMDAMYRYIAELSDIDVARGIEPLPTVLDKLKILSTMKDRVMCGLVTGNVEGIARRKMHAVGIWQTGALAVAAANQRGWPGSQDIAFLGGFGSDYCSGDITDLTRNHLDRARQIGIAVERGQSLARPGRRRLERVVHVGDAPADVLAAKAFALNRNDNVNDLPVLMIATATGSYSAAELQELAGANVPDQWECVVLEDGIADARFISLACGL